MSTERHNGETSFWSALCDVVVGLVLASALSIILARTLSYTGVDLLVLGQAALPLSLLPVWFALAGAVWRGQPIRSVFCAVLCVYWVCALFPVWRAQQLTKDADAVTTAQLRILSANVYVDNESDLANTVVGARADVLVFTEFSKLVESRLRRSGALDSYPFVATNGAEATWRTAIYSKVPFVGDVRAVPVTGDPTPGVPLLVADLNVNGQTVRIVGAHPMPLTVDGADRAFVATTRVIRDEVRAAGEGAVVVAGDLNGTRWLPATGELFDIGLRSAHETEGYGLSASWPMHQTLVRRFMRLDHLLYSKQLMVRSLADVSVPGSDHAASLATFAVLDNS
jgi:endonuclease/exonuclease/phosphatase (EEP) superfamily protein YafD